MKVFKCLFSGDEFVSDSYPHEFTFDGACLEVKGAYVKKGGNQIAIASDDIIEEDDDAPVVCNIVDCFQLQEITWTKKDFMAWVKPFLKNTAAKLTEIGQADRVDGFKKSATELVKHIAGRFDEFQVFTGQQFDMEGTIAFAYTKDEQDDFPTFLMFKDGMKEEKF
jgi:hypothetical protein